MITSQKKVLWAVDIFFDKFKISQKEILKNNAFEYIQQNNLLLISFHTYNRQKQTYN